MNKKLCLVSSLILHPSSFTKIAEDTMSEERTAVADTAPAAAVANGKYEPENVDGLRDGEHMRHRPGMYIGDTSVKGLHHLVYELVHNSVDEALAGYCKLIQVKINVDGSVTVGDDGRGIPVETHPKVGISTLE